LVFEELVHMIRGADAMSDAAPAIVNGVIDLGNTHAPVYRLFGIVAPLSVAAVLAVWLCGARADRGVSPTSGREAGN